MPVVGLCHGVHHVEGVIARFLGVEEGSITSFGHGLNHLTFLTRLRHRGADAVPLLHAKLAEQEGEVERELGEKQVWDNIVEGRAPRWSDDPFSWGLFREHGIFPCAMDRHATEFYPERFPGGAYHGHVLGRDAFPIDKRIALGDTWYEDMLAIARSPDPLPRAYYENVPGESEQLLQIMQSLMADRREVFSVNLPNGGTAPLAAGLGGDRVQRRGAGRRLRGAGGRSPAGASGGQAAGENRRGRTGRGRGDGGDARRDGGGAARRRHGERERPGGAPRRRPDRGPSRPPAAIRMTARLIAPDEGNLIDLPGVGPCPRPVDIDETKTGFSRLKSLRVYRFSAGQAIEGESEGDEVYVTALSGAADLEITGTHPLTTELRPGRVVYMTPGHAYRLTPQAETLVAYARAAAEGRVGCRLEAGTEGQGEHLGIARVVLAPGEPLNVTGEALLLVAEGRVETECGPAAALHVLAVAEAEEETVRAAEASVLYRFTAG